MNNRFMNNRISIIFITIMLVFLNADQMVMSPNIGFMEKEFGVNDTQIGLVASTFTILGQLLVYYGGIYLINIIGKIC